MYDQTTYVTLRCRSAGPGAHLPLARRQLVRHRDRQIQSVHERTARRPYRHGGVTQRSITACLQPEWGADYAPAWHGKLRGRLRRHPGREMQDLELHVPAEAVQRDQASHKAAGPPYLKTRCHLLSLLPLDLLHDRNGNTDSIINQVFIIFILLSFSECTFI